MLRGFQTRLLALFLPLLFGVQLLTLVVVQDTTEQRIVEQSSEALYAVSASFSSWLESTIRRLADSSALLATDFGFRSAIASRDTATMLSAIENARRRIGADVAAVVDLDGRIVAVNGGLTAGSVFPYREMLEQAERNGRAASIISVDGRLLQFVLVPVKVPDVAAWIGIGVDVGGATAVQLRDQSALAVDVSFAVAGADGWQLKASTAALSERMALEAALQAGTPLCPAMVGSGLPVNLRLGDSQHAISSKRLLVPHGGQAACMVIQRSLDAALAPYQVLFKFLWLFCVGGCTVGAVAAIVIARSVTRPVKQLAHAVAIVRQGRYPEPLAIAGPSEIEGLAQTFNMMVEGISEREQRIYEQANFDHTTGLPNRIHFERLVESRLGDEVPLLVFLVQLQNFREISNTLGYERGDDVIAACARRIGVAVTSADVLCRLDADRFALLASEVPEGLSETLASRIHAVFEEPVPVADINVDIIIRIGLARFPLHGDNARVLLRRAEIALDVACMRNCTHAEYDNANDRYNTARLSLISELRGSMDDGTLALYYQPKIDISSGRITQAEALMRWVSPLRGFVAPDEFIPLAEHTGFIGHLTRWALDRAASDARQWRERGLDLKLSVNVSTRDLLDPRLADIVLDTLSHHHLPRNAITLEVTESSMMEQPIVALSCLGRLAAAGISISIDDFGTGHSSMAYVGDMPASELKIDKCFVLDLPRQSKSQTIIRTIIQLAHSFDMHVCAEGVEDAATAELLAAYGCDYLQGWHYSKAVPADAFEALCAGWHAEPVLGGASMLRSIKA